MQIGGKKKKYKSTHWLQNENLSSNQAMEYGSKKFSKIKNSMG